MDDSTLRRLRCLAVWVAVTGTGSGLVLAVSGDLRPAPGAPFEEVLVAAAAWALCLAALWASAVTGLVAAEASRAGGNRPARGVPAPVRRLLLRACGAALAGGLVSGVAVVPATGTPSPLERPGSTQVGQAPPPPAGPVGTGRATRPVAAPAPAPSRTTSRPGDSLWRLAEAELRAASGREPSDADVAAYWPRIHATNRVLLGPDPDFLLPGVPIQLPAPDPQEIP